MAMQDEINQQVTNMLQQSGGKVMNMTNELAKIFLDYLRQQAEKAKSEKNLLYNTTGEVAIDKLQNAVKNGAELKNIFVVDEDMVSLERHLKSQDVLYAVTDIEKDNAKLISFLERDEEKIMQAVELLKAERGLISELTPQLFLDANSEKGFLMTTNLDKDQLELFRLYAKEMGIVFAQVNDEDRVSVLYEPEFKDKVNAALFRLGWDLNGPNGKAVREQVQHSLEAKKALSYAVDKGEDELYVVSANNIKNYVHISPEGFALYKNENEILSEGKDVPDYKDKVLDKVEGLNNPVVLTREEFERSLGERQQVVDNKYLLNTVPRDYNYIEESARIKNLQDLIRMKQGLNNEMEDTFAMYDPSISYTQFDGHEFASDQEIREARELEMQRYNESVEYMNKEFKTIEVSGENRSVDYIISRAAKLREEAVTHEEREHEDIER